MLLGRLGPATHYRCRGCGMDHSRLPERRPEPETRKHGPPTMRFVTKGVRQHCLTREYRDVDVTWAADPLEIGVVKGGVTGCESYRVSDLLRNRVRYEQHGLVVCAGTPGRWDKLYVPGDEMRVLFERVEHFLRESER